MPRKPNYRHERAEKTRSKEMKKQKKLLRREEATARRKAVPEGDPAIETGSGTPASEGE